MKQYLIVKTFHKTKQAKLSIVDENNDVLFDYKGQALTDMNFPYTHLETYSDLFELIQENEEFSIYYFAKDQ